jgi:hypothetical protein
VHAIAGTGVVFFGLDMKSAASKGLLGFTIERTNGNSKKWLAGGKAFPGADAGKRADSRTAPIQAFLWGDYEVQQGKTYTYTVTPRYGKPEKPRDGKAVTLEIQTENPDDGRHGVFFNRGVAGSQAYSRQFGAFRRYYLVEKLGRETWKDFIRPDAIPDRKAWRWLSRGLEVAMSAFIRKSEGPPLRSARRRL